MNRPLTISINARYSLEPTITPLGDGFDVIDKALVLQFKPAVVFSNGTEAECREWVERNCEEPKSHTKGSFEYFKWLLSQEHEGAFPKQDLALAATAPKLLALVEQYHQSFPTKESGALIAEARGWTI